MGLNTNARLCDCIRVDTVYDPLGDTDLSGVMVDMQDFDRCLVMILPAVTTASDSHLITGFKIVSNTTAAAGGTDHDCVEATTTEGGTTVLLAKEDMGIVATTALHSQHMHLDIGADQMYPGDRYIRAVTTSTGTYASVFVYIRYNAHSCHKDMIQATRLAFQYDGDVT